MKRMTTIATALKASSYGIVGFLLIDGKGQEALWGIVIAQVGSAITNWINRRADRLQREQQHQWDKEEREAKAMEVKAELARSQAVLSAQVESIGKRADAAYDAGNHATEKIAALASRPVIVTMTTPTKTN